MTISGNNDADASSTEEHRSSTDVTSFAEWLENEGHDIDRDDREEEDFFERLYLMDHGIDIFWTDMGGGEIR